MATITVDYDTFIALFPELLPLTAEQVAAGYDGAGSYIATEQGLIGLDLKSQTRGVYLATAHIIYMHQNPDKFRQLGSASEGSVSASFNAPPTKDMRDYYLSLSPYGLELLAILSTVQPPLPRKPMNIFPYYSKI
jgi:hypothetical protein